MAAKFAIDRRVRGLAALAALCLPLAACSGGSMADLHAYAQDVLARKGSGIEPLPPVKLPEVYAYKCAEEGCVDPFEPFFKEEAATKTAENKPKNSGIQPPAHNKEELEQYALDSLRMVGTLEQGGETWGIVRSPDSIIHRVKVGNYMGKNNGKITDITDVKIALQEIVPDGQGGWMERPASLALAE